MVPARITTQRTAEEYYHPDVCGTLSDSVCFEKSEGEGGRGRTLTFQTELVYTGCVCVSLVGQGGKQQFMDLVKV